MKSRLYLMKLVDADGNTIYQVKVFIRHKIKAEKILQGYADMYGYKNTTIETIDLGEIG